MENHRHFVHVFRISCPRFRVTDLVRVILAINNEINNEINNAITDRASYCVVT